MPTNIRNVDLNLLKVFDAIMEEHSISRAAVRLSVSQPAISNALNRLRVLYEDELFIRTAKGVAPTPKANEIAGIIRESLNNVSATLSAGEEFTPATSQRKFKVALTDYGELYFLPHLMQRLEKIAPDIDIICLPDSGATMTVDMKTGLVDLVWDWKKIDDNSFVTEEIFRDKGYCIARKNHPKIAGELSLETFLDLEHVVLRMTRTHVPMIEKQLEKRNLERKVVTEVSHLFAIPGIVAATDLIAVLPERIARHFATLLNLDVYPNPVYEESVSVYQMWHQHFNNDAGHTWFRELLASVVRDLE